MTQAFNLSQLANNVNTSGQLNAAAGLYNQVPVANGGTGVASVATGSILVGAGTAAMTAVAAGAANNVLTSNGTTWTSAASQGGPAPVVTVYTSPATWTKPATIKGVKVTVVGGGGSGFIGATNPVVIPYTPAPVGLFGRGAGGGGGAGVGVFSAPAIPGPISVSVGSGGASVSSIPAGVSGNAGGSSSFGALITATGGGAGINNAPSFSFGGGAGGSITTSPAIYGSPGMPGQTIPYIIYGNNTSYLGGNSGLGYGMGGGLSPQPATLQAVIGYGAGGASQQIGTGNTSQAGANGVVIVEEFY